MKISGIERKYFTALYYKKFTGEILDTKIKEKGLIDISNASNLITQNLLHLQKI